MFEVWEWLIEHDFEQLVDLFEEREIDGEAHFELSDDTPGAAALLKTLA